MRSHRRWLTWLATLALLALGCASTTEAPPAPVVAQTPPPPPPKPVDPREFEAKVYFEEGSADLSDAGRMDLKRFAAKLSPYSERSVHVAGYSEASGPEEGDRWLSERRAKTVASYLIAIGIGADRVTLQGMGAEAPVAEARAVAQAAAPGAGSSVVAQPPGLTSESNAPSAPTPSAAVGEPEGNRRLVQVTVH